MAPAARVTTTVTELPESRVRVQAEVPAEEIERQMQQAARQIGRGLRIPGFRTGKVPPPVIIQRVGRQTVLDEAVRDSIGLWYTAAIDDAHIVPVGDPDLDLGELPGEGEPWRFSIEIGVRPTATLGEYKNLEVGKPQAEVADEDVEDQVTSLRERQARLETIDRPAQRGDFVVLDFVGTVDGVPFQGGEARDQMLELGAKRMIPGFEEQLEGAVAGEERTLKVTFPEDYRATELAGNDAEFATTVKEVKQKVLPELDDDFAVDQGFDSLDELRADIRERLATAQEERLESDYREAVLDAAVANASVTVPEPLIEARAKEMFDQMVHTLSHQGINKDLFLKMSGKDEESAIADNHDDARKTLEREAVLAAIVEKEGISPSDDEVLEAIGDTAERSGTSPKKLLERLKSAGRLEGVREDLATKQAVDLLVESATPIDQGRAEAREKLWTPGDK